MKTNKGVLFAFVALTAFECSTFEVTKHDKVESITDQEIIELKKAFLEHIQLLESGQIDEFPTYQEFLTNAAMLEKENLTHDLNSQPMEGASVSMKIYDLNLSPTEFIQLELRINNANLNRQKGRISKF